MSASSSTSSAGTLAFLSAGAAQGLVQALQPAFTTESGLTFSGRFGAVGAMKEALLAGERCDFFVSTHRMVQDLVAEGRLLGDSVAPLGRVPTGVAVRAGEPVPEVASSDALRRALAAAPALYFPDPERATAGIHFARVLGELGLAEATRTRWRNFPNGATAMRELATGGPPGAIGCTQASEILITAGVQLAGLLPAPFELSTLYTAAASARAASPQAARRFITRLAAPAHRSVRERCGMTEP